MSLSKHNIVVGLLIIVGIILLILTISFFKRQQPVKDVYFEKYMALKDSMINHAIQDANDYRLLYEQSKRQDSTTMANLIQSQKNFTIKFNDNLSKIPINIANIAGNDDSIRSAYANY